MSDHILEYAFFSLEERTIWTGAVVHGRQEKEKRRQKEKGRLSEGEHGHLFSRIDLLSDNLRPAIFLNGFLCVNIKCVVEWWLDNLNTCSMATQFAYM